MSFWTNPIKATKAFFGTKQPPRVQTQANNPIANQFKPINFASIFDELSKDKMDIIRNMDGKVSLRFGNDKNSIDLNKPVNAGSLNSKLPLINPINQRAAEVVLLSQAMTRLGNVIEETEKTNPYLVEQNRGLIDSFRSAAQSTLDRGFDFRQYAIDQRLKKMGLDNSSTAFGMQVALAREKANAYAEMEFKQAELAQGLKQQAIANLHQRGDLLGKNAQVELARFNSENQAELANQELLQKQAYGEKQLELQQNQQRIDTEFANKAMMDSRRQRMAALGLDLFNEGNKNALGARQIDNSAVAQQNYDQLNRFKNTNNPWEHEVGRKLLSNTLGKITGNFIGMNPWGGNNTWN